MPRSIQRQRTLLLLLVAGLALALQPVVTRPALASHEVTTERIAGSSRFATAAEVARAAYPDGASEAILARGDDFPDALGAAGLAAALDAPILLTGRDELPEVTAEVLDELGVETVTVLGGEAAVSDEVAVALRRSYAVARLSGPDRYATAAAVARAVAARLPITDDFDHPTALLVSGERFPDALAAGGLAANGGWPILLTASHTLPTATREALDDLGIERVYVIGGGAAISPEVVEVVKVEDRLTTRISGRTRQETAVAVAEYGDTFTDLLREDALITRPDDFADALAAGALAGARRAAILLADGGGLDDATRSWLHDACPALHRVTAVGGKAVVDDTVLASAQEVGDCHVEVTGVCLTSGAGPAEEREGSPDRLADILFVTDRQGYVVGDGGIYATTDAGATWQLQLEIDAQLRHVNFIDASHGWAVGEDRILATDDGGVCWRDLPMPDPTLEEVQFHSPMDGIGVAQEPEDFDEPPPTVTLLRTNDGGQTWAPVETPGPVRASCFTDDDRGWALLARGTEPQEARAVRTNDGGASWAFLLSVDSTGNDVDLQCASHQVAWLLLYGGAAGGSRTYEGYRLSDADGAQQVTCYRFQSSCASSGLGGSYPGPLSSVGPENAVFLTYTPSFDADNVSFRILTAASATDRSAPIPRMRSPSAAAFRSTELGWVVGSGDAGQEIVRTTDGGASWTSQLVIPRQQ